MLHGIRGDVQGLQAGDTVEIPPLSGEVTVEGMVRRPAIYELHGEKSLAEVLELAGGVLPSGTLRHVDVERVESHEGRTMLRLDIPETDSDAEVATRRSRISLSKMETRSRSLRSYRMQTRPFTSTAMFPAPASLPIARA